MSDTAARLYVCTSASKRSKPALRSAWSLSRIGVDVAKINLRRRFLLNARQDRLQVFLVFDQRHLVALVFQLQVVQAGIEVNDVGLFLDDPFVEVPEHVAAVLAVRLRTDDDRFTVEPLCDQRCVTHADGIADQDDLGQRLLLSSRARDQNPQKKQRVAAGQHGGFLLSGAVR